MIGFYLSCCYLVVCVATSLANSQETQPPPISTHHANSTAVSRPGYPGLLLWTELNVRSKRARINSLPADPGTYISSPSIVTTGFYENTPAHWIAITNDYDDELVFWTDASRKQIMKGGLGDGSTALPVFKGTSQTVDGIAVDWLANNLYWADGAYDWIIVTNYNVSQYKTLIDTRIDKPRGIAVYPQRGYLFWTDWGDSQKVERSSLSGENRTLISDSDLYYPNGLAVDYTTDKLYWVDADPSGSRIEVCDLDGTDRRTLFSVEQGQGHLFDLTIIQEYIFVTDWHEQVRCIRKSLGDQYFSLNIGARPFGVTAYGPGNLPGTQSPCDSSPCEHLCMSDSAGYKCLCSDNYVLQEDGRTCEKVVNALAIPQVLLATKTSLCHFPGNFADLVITQDQEVECFLSNRSFAVAMEVDIASHLLFYSDYDKKTIERVRLLQGESVDTIRSGVGSVEGLAVDWLTENIYWTDALNHYIAVSRYDGQHRMIVVKKHVIKPRSIAIHANLRLMFWTEFGPPAHIEKAGLDGRSRDVIVTGLTNPNGLTIDFQYSRLYFADRESGSIFHVNFDGGDKRSLYTREGAQYFNMDIYKDYLIWTEWNNFNGIHALNRENSRVTQSVRIGTHVYDVKMYAPERQPDGISECGADNGGCQHLCLPRKYGGFRCACGTGYTLADDERSCVTTIVTDDFMLATDSYLHGIIQIFIDDKGMGFTALDLGPMTNPIAVEYDPVESRVYWSDVKDQTISRAFLNGTGREVILGPSDGIGIPDGIALDTVSRLIYWTDAEANTTSVSKLDGSHRKTLISENLDRPRALALDIQNGYMYWSDWGENPMIERAFMNGTNRETIITTGLGWPNGIALDLSENLIYWCDAFTNKIERSSLTGENREIMIDLHGSLDAHPFGIAVHGPYIIWTDWTKRSPMKARKVDGSDNGTAGWVDFIRLNSIKMYLSSEVSGITTVCAGDNGGCSGLCLPTPGGVVCACQDGDYLRPDGKTCWRDLACPLDIPHGRISDVCLRTNNNTCNVNCNEGYILGAIDIQVRCLTTGNWDIDTSFLCQVVECSPLPLPVDTTALPCLSPYLYGMECWHRCEVGLRSIGGDEQRRCQADGTWSGTDLICGMVTCAPLVSPANGSYSNSNCTTVGGNYNDLCAVQCQDGYQLLGVTERSCLATGEWTDWGINSTCVDVTMPVFQMPCEDIAVIAHHGQTQANVSFPKPIATDNSGIPVKIWSRRDEYLSPPVLLDEGDYIMTFYAQDLVHNTAGCTFVITVTVLHCPELESPNNGYYDNCQDHHGASCAVTCNRGYRPQGDVSRSCEIDENSNPYWTGQPPTCRRIRCREARTDPNALTAMCRSPYLYGTSCFYICKPGYVRVRGSKFRTCQEDASWSGKQLQCEVQRCGALEPFNHGIITPAVCTTSGRDSNQFCRVSCEEGFFLVGAGKHKCSTTGWTNNPEDGHICIDYTAPHFNNTCPDDFTIYAQRGEQDAIATWTFHVADNNKDDIVNVTSSKQSGTRLAEGNHTVLVRAWDTSGNMGTCQFTVTVKIVRCPDLLPISSNQTECETHYGAQCSFDCDVGYLLLGSSIITCEWNHQGGSDGYWTGDQPTCQTVMCPPLLQANSTSLQCSTDGYNETDWKSYGTICREECRHGYSLSEPSIQNNILSCQSNGEWSGDRLDCERIHCSPIEVSGTIVVTSPDCLDQGRFTDVCSLSCPDGYVMKGPSLLTCNAYGRWDHSNMTRYHSMLASRYNTTLPTSTCVDVTPPDFECSHFNVIYVGPCQNSSLIYIKKPIASDNSGSVIVQGPETYHKILSVGEHRLTYLAVDEANNQAVCTMTINVRIRKCEGRVPPQENLVSLSCAQNYGSVATYSCPKGQRSAATNQSVMCGFDGEWIGKVPPCEDITCEPLQLPPVSWASPPKCSQNAMPVSTTCYVNCNHGYSYRGIRKATCQDNGAWSIDVSTVICVDFMAPGFERCPKGIDVELPLESNQTSVNWDIPIATDNSGEDPVVKIAIGMVPPLTLGPGHQVIQYVAIDAVGNKDYCIFTITVHDVEAPRVKQCPVPVPIQVVSIPVYITWVEPMFTDNIAVTKVTSTQKPGFKVYSWGRQTITYTAQDAAGNEAQCLVFIDIVDSKTCLRLAPPANGALACENDRHCTIHCNDGYAFTDTDRPESTYDCLGNGFWGYGDNMERAPNLPACAKVTTNNPVNWQRRDKVKFQLHHLDGNCEDVQQQIQEKFQQLLRSSTFMDYCRSDPTNNCKVDNVEVQCGDVDGPKRKRRQTDEQQQNDILSLIYNLFGQRNDSEEIDALLRVMNMSISDVFGGNNITLIIDGQPVVLSSKEGEAGQIEVTCDANQTLADDGLSCVYCPVGTRYNQLSYECIQCPIGSYQIQPAQMSCKGCPLYTSTASKGATTLSLCIDVCEPGMYSPSGLEPCQQCPQGTYQHNRGEMGCTPCPEGMTTRNTGATTIIVCLSQDQVGPAVTTPSNVAISVTLLRPVSTPYTRITTSPAQDQVGPAVTTPSNAPISVTLLRPVSTTPYTRITTSSSGKVDIGTSLSSVVITKVFTIDKDTKTNASPAAHQKTSGGGLSRKLIIGLVVGILLAVILIGICIGVVMSKLHRKVPRGARPLSWAGSDAETMIDEDDDNHELGYHKLEEHPDYNDTRVDGDKRYFAANAIANPAYEPTLPTYKDNRKSSVLEDPFGDSFQIFTPSGPLDSVSLN